MFWDSCNDGRERRKIAQLVLLRHLRSETIQVHILSRLGRIQLSFVVLYQGIRDVGAGLHIPLVFQWQLEIVLELHFRGYGTDESLRRHIVCLPGSFATIIVNLNQRWIGIESIHCKLMYYDCQGQEAS